MGDAGGFRLTAAQVARSERDVSNLHRPRLRTHTFHLHEDELDLKVLLFYFCLFVCFFSSSVAQ